MAWRYYLQRALTNEWLDRDANLLDVDLSLALSGPGAMKAHVDAVYANAVDSEGVSLFEEWQTFVYAENDGVIRWGGILDDSVDAGNGERDLTFISFSGYPKGRVYTGDYSVFQADAFEIIRYLWKWVQSDEYGDIGVSINGGLSGIVVGGTDPGPEPTRNDGESAESYQARLVAWQTKRDTPYELAWYDTPDIGSEIDSLISQAGAEYVEVHEWEDADKLSVRHYISIARPNTQITHLPSPQTLPDANYTWDYVDWPQFPNIVTNRQYEGLTDCYANQAHAITCVVTDYGGDTARYSLVEVVEDSGAVVQSASQAVYSPITMGGVAAVNGYYVVLYQASRYWYTDVWNQNFQRVRTNIVGSSDPNHLSPADVLINSWASIGRDLTNGRPMIAWANGSSGIGVKYLDNALASTGSVSTLNTFPGIGNSRMGMVERGPFDYGGDSIVFGVTGNAMFVTDISGNRYEDTRMWHAGFGGNVLGGFWDGTQFHTYDANRRYVAYTGLRLNAAGGPDVEATFSYSWYDPDTDDGTHETLTAGVRAITVPRRSKLQVTVTQPPEYFRENGQNAADQVRLYGSFGGGSRTLVATIDQDPWSTTFTQTVSPSSTYEPTRNSFEDVQYDAPPIGTRRFDLRFVEGENIVVPPLPQRKGDQYANFVIGIGASQDRDLYYETSRIDGRLRRDIVLPLKDTYDPGRIKLTSDNYLAIVQNIMTIDTVEVFDHPNAPIGSWSLGDEILIQTFSSFEQINDWVKVVGWSVSPNDGDTAILNVVRIV